MYNYPGPGFNPLDSLRQQLQNQMTSLSQQLVELEKMGNPFLAPPDPAIQSTVRNEVDRYLQERQQLPAPQDNTLALIVNSIEKGMSQDDLQFIMQNPQKIPEFFQSKDGLKLIQNFVTNFKKSNNFNLTADQQSE